MKDDILQVGTPVVVCHHVSRSAPGSDGECGHCCKRSTRRRTQTDVQRWRRRERQAKRREARLRDTSQNSSCSEEEEHQDRSARDATQKGTLSDGDSPMRLRKGTRWEYDVSWRTFHSTVGTGYTENVRIFDQTVEAKTKDWKSNKFAQNNDHYRSLLKNHTLTELILTLELQKWRFLVETHAFKRQLRNHLESKYGWWRYILKMEIETAY